MTGLYRISPDADDDIDNIWKYIAADNPVAASRVVAGIGERFAMLARQPLIGEAREDLASDLREFPVGNYVIYYRPLESGDVSVEIVRVIHGARDIGRIF